MTSWYIVGLHDLKKKKYLKYMKRVDKIKCKYVNGIDNALASTYDHQALRINT